MPSDAKLKETYARCDTSTKKHVERLVLIHDLGLKACVDKNLPRLEEVLDVLQKRLVIARHPSLGLALYAQYTRARNAARNGNFLLSGKILARLRAAWTGHGKIAVRRFVS
jgi:hypothetical protein